MIKSITRCCCDKSDEFIFKWWLVLDEHLVQKHPVAIVSFDSSVSPSLCTVIGFSEGSTHFSLLSCSFCCFLILPVVPFKVSFGGNKWILLRYLFTHRFSFLAPPCLRALSWREMMFLWKLFPKKSVSEASEEINFTKLITCKSAIFHRMMVQLYRGLILFGKCLQTKRKETLKVWIQTWVPFHVCCCCFSSSISFSSSFAKSEFDSTSFSLSHLRVHETSTRNLKAEVQKKWSHHFQEEKKNKSESKE